MCEELDESQAYPQGQERKNEQKCINTLEEAIDYKLFQLKWDLNKCVDSFPFLCKILLVFFRKIASCKLGCEIPKQ